MKEQVILLSTKLVIVSNIFPGSLVEEDELMIKTSLLLYKGAS